MDIEIFLMVYPMKNLLNFFATWYEASDRTACPIDGSMTI
jgi:hypothetical protein